MPATAEQAVTVAECDERLLKLSAKYRLTMPATELRAELSMEIDKWLERRLICSLAEESA